MADQGNAEVAIPDTEAPVSPASLARRERLNLLQLVSDHLHLTNSAIIHHPQLLNLLVKESLGTKRRDYISTRDFRENIGPGVSLDIVQASRLSNVPGTEEHRQSQVHQQELSAWNSMHARSLYCYTYMYGVLTNRCSCVFVPRR